MAPTSRTTTAIRSEVADPGLAPHGRARIEWAEGQMPVLRSLRERFARERPLEGVSVGACLQVTAETGVLTRTRGGGGAGAWLCPANPLTTQDEVAADLGVDARRGEDADAW